MNIINKFKKHKETLGNSFWRALQVFSKQGIVFIIFLISAQILSPYEFGIYNYVIAFVTLLAMIGDFGISTATSKFTAEFNVIDKEKIKLILFNSVILILGISGIILLVTILFGPGYFNENYKYALYTLPLIILIPIVSLYDGIYRGLKKFKKISIISFVIGIIFLSLAYPVINKFKLEGALIIQVAFYFVLMIVLISDYREFKIKLSRDIINKIGNYSLIYGLAVLGYQLFAKIDVLILGRYGYIEQIATYEFINKFLLILLVPFSIIGQVVAPNFTRDFAKEKYNLIYKKLINYSIFFGLLSFFIGLLVYLFFPFFVKIIFIKYYNNFFGEIFVCSLIIFIINASTAAIDSGIVVSTGFAFIMTKYYLILGIINILLSLMLLNIFGYIGVILSTVFSSLVMVLCVRIIYFKKLKKLL